MLDDGAGNQMFVNEDLGPRTGKTQAVLFESDEPMHTAVSLEGAAVTFCFVLNVTHAHINTGIAWCCA